jgi:transcriptional regulator with XRE-family HTH domain
MGTGAGETYDTIGGARTMGEAIVVLRRLTGLSQQAVAARVDMHVNYFSSVERGKVRNPGLVTTSRIANGLGVSIGVLAANFVRPSAIPLSQAAFRPSGPVEKNYHGARELGAAIRLQRRRADLTQARLSENTGLHRGHLSSIEAGRKQNPGLGTIAKIASGIDPRPAELSALVADLARVFTGELTVHELRTRIPTTSGPPVSLGLPPEATGT